MKISDFEDFHNCSKLFNLNLIPFSKIFQLRITRDLFSIEYRLNPESDFIKVNIRQYQRNIRNPKDCEFPTPKTSAKKIEISREKKKRHKSYAQLLLTKR